MNAGPAEAESPAGIFIPGHRSPVCGCGAVTLPGAPSRLARRITHPPPNAAAAGKPGKVVGAGRDEDS